MHKMATKSIAVITTSTRKPRVGSKVTDLVLSALQPVASSSSSSSSKITLTHVDLATFSLPLFDESVIPATLANAATEYEHAHSRAWSAEIAKHDGYILTVPEYNYGMAAGTKNAIDYLYNEWKGKPVGVISYGIQGGNMAREQVRKSLGGVGLKVVKQEIGLAFPGGSQAGDFKEAMFTGTMTENARSEWEGKAGEMKTMLEEIVEELEKDLGDKVGESA